MKQDPGQGPQPAEGSEPARVSPSPGDRNPAPCTSRWTLLSNHAHVLVCLAVDPDARLREMAQRIGITQRSVQNVLQDLEREGLVHRERQGRRNHYRLQLDQPLRHPLEAHRTVGELVEMLVPDGSAPGREPDGFDAGDRAHRNRALDREASPADEPPAKER